MKLKKLIIIILLVFSNHATSDFLHSNNNSQNSAHENLKDKEQKESEDDAHQTKNKNKNTREIVYDSAVNFANWIDSFFGQSEELEDADFDYLRLRNDFIFRSGEKPRYRPKIKAKVKLPQLSNRVSLIISNEPKENKTEADDSTDLETIADKTNSTSAALNYETDSYRRSKFDFRVGLGSGLEPFSFARHTFQAYKSDTLTIKNYNYLIWREDDGLGLSTKIKLSKVLTLDKLFRWEYSFLRAEKTYGNEWSSGVAIVDQLGDERWIAYQLGAFGESDHDWDVNAYRFALRYRTKTEIDWLFFEVEPAYSYVKTIEKPQGSYVPSIRFRFEIKLEH